VRTSLFDRLLSAARECPVKKGALVEYRDQRVNSLWIVKLNLKFIGYIHFIILSISVLNSK
jgi:hypothetical protein